MSTTLTAACLTSLKRDTQIALNLLDRIEGGLLEISLPGGAHLLCGQGEARHSLHIHDERTFALALARGDIGFAEAYLDGYWDTPDLTGLLTLLAANRSQLQRAVYGNWRTLISARLRHWLNGNTKAGSKRNIMAHYDLGNAFYARWLDKTMSYSSALFAKDNADTSLEDAQQAKYQRILDRLAARPGDSVLEIGCGWGGFAEMATAAGLNLTGLTLSPAQLEWAQRRVPQADLRLQDYRDTQSQFDHIVSIEMFEAVGERYWPSYFATLRRALKPGGRAVVQSITIADALFPSYRKGTDFIQQYIFPGGMLPSRSAFAEQARRAGLRVTDEFAFGLDYARTLALWRDAFEAAWPEISTHGFDERFRRLWRMYLCYCEAGFRVGNIDVVQFQLEHA